MSDTTTEKHYKNEHLIAALCHLCPYVGWLPPILLLRPLLGFSILPPVLLWAYFRKKSDLMDECGKQVINYHITANFWIMVLGLILVTVTSFEDPMARMALSFVFGSGIMLIFFLYIVLGLFGALMSAKQKPFRYPFIFQMVK